MSPSSTTRLIVPLVAALLGLAAAMPAPQESSCSPRTICVDAINTCGVKYGGCYDVCNTSLKPTAPPCTETTTTTPTSTPVVTDPPVVTPEPTGEDNCSTRTVCWDGINDCGQTYGGCFPDCKPWPTFTAPPCPPIVTSTPTPTSEPEPTGCADLADECGKWYVGCVPNDRMLSVLSKSPCPKRNNLMGLCAMLCQRFGI